MSIQMAGAILQRLGPCRIALDRDGLAELARELALMGCDPVDPDAPADARTVGLLHWPSADLGPAFAAALQRYAGCGTLALLTEGQPRHPLEKALFAAGWQRHPVGMMHGDYAAWSAARMPGLTYHARGGETAFTALSAGGAEADGTIARYAMAATHVRPGDHVLIDGEAGTDGAAILAALSRAGSITRREDAAALVDHSIDMIVAFEPPSDDWAGRIIDYAQLLKFDGRLVLGWRKRPGDNGRPHDWPTLREALSQWLLPETRYLQRPASIDPSGPHLLQTAPIDSALESPWLIAVAAANPLAGEGQAEAYDHPAFPRAADPLPVLVDFGAAYDNPFLYRAMVQMGERIGHDVTLARLAECVAEDARPDSADRGAALTVLGYRVLEMRQPELTPPLLRAIAAYMEPADNDGSPAHVTRWRLSLAFLAGRLCELAGDRDAAHGWYRRAARADWQRFSPLLTTKSIAAAFYEARLCLAEGDMDAARDCFRHGLDTALAAVTQSHRDQMGSADRPLPFYMQELAEVVDMGSQCANALAHLPLWERDPGLFWRQVDVRRFGLASWARDLERENARLRAA